LDEEKLIMFVHASFQRWEDVRGVSIDYTYMGTIDVDTPDPDNPREDGFNVIYVELFEPWDELCYSIPWVDEDNLIVEFDIVMNSGGNWGDFDFQSVLMHEIGHTLGLGDLFEDNDRPEIMYWNFLWGQHACMHSAHLYMMKHWRNVKNTHACICATSPFFKPQS